MKIRGEVENILFNNLMPINAFEELEDFKPLDDNIINYINKIFIQLIYFKGKIFTEAEINMAYTIIYNDVWLLNDILCKLQSENLIELIFEIIENIFEELFVLFEDYEMFEAASNVLKIKGIWLGDMSKEKILNWSAVKR